MHQRMNYCLVYRRSGNHLRNMVPANKVYRNCDDLEPPAVTQLHPRTRNTADRQTE